MKHLFEKPVNFVLVTAFLGAVLFSSLTLGPIGMISVAEAHHKPGHDCGGCPPPSDGFRASHSIYGSRWFSPDFGIRGYRLSNAKSE